MKILVFTEGTITIFSTALGKSRAEAVQMSEDKWPEVHFFKKYVPLGKAVEKLQSWKNQGAEIVYMTSRTEPEEIEDDCESIGGEEEMTHTNIKPELKPKIKHIVIKEFAGIDQLPDNLIDLNNYG